MYPCNSFRLYRTWKALRKSFPNCNWSLRWWHCSTADQHRLLPLVWNVPATPQSALSHLSCCPAFTPNQFKLVVTLSLLLCCQVCRLPVMQCSDVVQDFRRDIGFNLLFQDFNSSRISVKRSMQVGLLQYLSQFNPGFNVIWKLLSNLKI